MPKQEEHDKPENLVEEAEPAVHAAHSLNEAADSNQSLDGFYAMNNERAPEPEDKDKSKKKD